MTENRNGDGINIFSEDGILMNEVIGLEFTFAIVAISHGSILNRV